MGGLFIDLYLDEELNLNAAEAIVALCRRHQDWLLPYSRSAKLGDSRYCNRDRR